MTYRWSQEAQAAIDAVDRAAKKRKRNTENKAEHQQDCPFCVAGNTPNPVEGAMKICSTAKDRDECFELLHSMAETYDRPSFDFEAERLRQVAGPTETVTKFIEAARKAWFKEKQ